MCVSVCLYFRSIKQGLQQSRHSIYITVFRRVSYTQSFLLHKVMDIDKTTFLCGVSAAPPFYRLCLDDGRAMDV